MDTMWAATRDVPLSVLISPPPAGTFGCYPQIPNNRPANGCHPSYLTPMALLQSARAFSDASAALANDTTSSTSSFRGRVERAWMGVENPPVSHSMLQMILLPRQARDNHGEEKLRKLNTTSFSCSESLHGAVALGRTAGVRKVNLDGVALVGRSAGRIRYLWTDL